MSENHRPLALPSADLAGRALTSGPAPVRVMHVLGSLSVGGVETWLARVVRALDARRLAIDFLLHSDDPGTLAREVRERGCRIFTAPPPRSPVRYAGALRTILDEAGPFDVVHSHVHHFSGWVLRVAHAAGVPSRIAHSHSDTAVADAASSLARRAYLNVMRREIARHMTCGLAASRSAARALFGDAWERDARIRVLHCGIDTEPFRAPGRRAAVRAALGIAPDAFVVGHVGRFTKAKNHAFLVEVARELAAARRDARFLWVGDGALVGAIRALAAAAGLADRIVFTGERADVPALLGAMDAFAFPSLWEGMPLSLVEAQAAGLPCVISDVIAPEAIVVSELVTALPVAAGASAWAAALARAARGRAATRPEAALAAVEASTFSLAASASALEHAYGC